MDLLAADAGKGLFCFCFCVKAGFSHRALYGLFDLVWQRAINW